MALIDLLRRPADVWVRKGHSQIVRALIVVFVGLIGPMLYLLIARPAVDAVPAATRPSSLPADSLPSTVTTAESSPE